MFDELLASVNEMNDIVKGKIQPSRTFNFPDLEVKHIREKTGLSQSRFAILIGVSKRTLENWEQGRRSPAGPARSLLRLVDNDPDYMIKALHA